jgi:hypothetical protein
VLLRSGAIWLVAQSATHVARRLSKAQARPLTRKSK